jgi:hypothetical protein
MWIVVLRRVLVPLLLVVIAAFAGDAAADPPVLIDGLVARVNDRTIYRSDVAARLGKDDRVEPHRRLRAMHELLDRMIDETLIERACLEEAAGCRTLETDATAEIAQMARDRKTTADEIYDEMAKKGFTREQFLNAVLRRKREERWLAAYLRDLTAPAANAPDKEVAQYRGLVAQRRHSELSKLRAKAYVEVRW